MVHIPDKFRNCTNYLIKKYIKLAKSLHIIIYRYNSDYSYFKKPRLFMKTPPLVSPFTIIFLFVFLLFHISCFSQSEEKNYPVVEGQVLLSTNGHAAFLNLGGVNLKFIFKKFNLGINMGPSIKFENESSKLNAVPVLGIGPQIYLFKNKKLIVSFLAYYLNSKKIWTQSAGIGYILTGSK